MPKSPDAFRTISEVADWLGVQAHVLRFWESKFTQIKPVKRAGGRRYYRPNDMLLLGGIRKLLHDDGLTIKGAQKLLRNNGIAHVAALSPPLDEAVTPAVQTPKVAAEVAKSQEEPAKVVPFAQPAASSTPTPANAEKQVEAQEDKPSEAAPSNAALVENEPVVKAPFEAAPTHADLAKEEDAPQAVDPVEDATRSATQIETPTMPEPTHAPETVQAAPSASLPSFLQTSPKVEAPTPPKPRDIGAQTFKDESDFHAEPGALTASFRCKSLSSEQRELIRPIMGQLSALRTAMAQATDTPQ